MYKTLKQLCCLCFCSIAVITAHAQGTAFNYQGRLSDNGAPATGNYDLQFTIYDALINGTSLGTVTNAPTTVSNGLFTVSLDFGANIFNGNARSIEIGVRTNGSVSAYTVLNPRQPITSTPYAIQSVNAVTANGVTGTVSAAQVTGNIPASQLSGTLSTAQLPVSVVTNGANGVNISGTFSGNGSGITNVNLITANSMGAINWTSNYPGFFVKASTLTVGNTLSSPRYVVSVDVNGDNKLDLISANLGANSLTVFTNNGSGGFSLSATLSAGSGPISVTAADVNGDNKVDLISVNAFGNTLTLLTNNGSGGFSLFSTISVGGGPRSVAAADINVDGKIDLICAGFSTNKLTVLTNDGNGVFTLSSSPQVVTSGQCVIATDVNGDNVPDLISVSSVSGYSLTVLINNGSGVFFFDASYNVGTGNSLTAADVNGDSNVDLVSVGSSGGVTILTNNGSGSGRFTLSSTLSVGGSSSSVTTADVNGDGKADLISASSSGNTVVAWTNNGSGVFTVASTTGVGHGPAGVAAADVSGDGRPDLISADSSDGTLTVLFNSIAYTAYFSGNGSGLSGLNASSISSGIFSGNASGLTNLNASSIASGTLSQARLPASVVTNNATGVTLNGTFSGDGSGLTNLNASALASGTLSQAQLPAVVVTNNASGVTLNGTFSGNGSNITGINLASVGSNSAINWATNYPGNFVTSASLPDQDAHFVVSADMNGDGKMDLISSSYFGTTALRIFTNNGSGGFALAGSAAAGDTSYSVAVMDMNFDGKYDLLSAGNGGNLEIYTNAGNYVFGLSSSIKLTNAASSSIEDMVLADVDGDHAVDVIAVHSSYNVVGIFKNNGGGSFNNPYYVPIASYAQPHRVTAADVNGDGKIDLITTDQFNSLVTIYTNNGFGAFTTSLTVPGLGGAIVSAVAADVNGDGKVDLAVAKNNNNTLVIVTNSGNGTFTVSSSVGVGLQPIHVTAADVNGDGKVDLISANTGTNTLTVVTNNGSGGFAIASSPVVGAYPKYVAWADVNGDGKPDLVSANDLDNTMTVLLDTPTITTTFTGNGGGLTNLNASALVGALSGNGSGLTNLNASSITSGTLSQAQLPASVVTNTATGVTLSGTFSGNGGGLTNLNASSISSGTFSGNGAGLTNIALASVNGTISSNTTFTVTGNRASGFNNPVVVLQNTSTSSGAGPALRVVTEGGSGSTPDGALSVSANVSGTAANSLIARFGNSGAWVAAITNDGTIYATGFSGSGSALTSLNASQLSSGTVPIAQLPSAVLTNKGAIAVGSLGTTITNLVMGQASAPFSMGLSTATNFTVSFGVTYSSVPKVIATVANDPNFAALNETWVLFVRSVTTTGFSVNLQRVDTTGTSSGQSLRVNWQAWQ